MDTSQQFAERARQAPKRIVLPEGDDARMVAAAVRLKEEGIAHPVLLGSAAAVAAAAAEAGGQLAGVEVVDPAADGRMARYVEGYAAKREVSPGLARRLVRKPLYFGAMMVAEGDADGGVAGLASTTTSVIQAAALCIGYAPGASQASSLFIMELPGREPLVYADAAIVPQPSARELAEIAVTTARSARALLGIEPLVALLSFSTYGSAAHPDVDKVRQATALAREMAPDVALDGELQADAALSPRVAARKGATSAVAGHANVLVFPDLDAANIAYKLTQYLAGAKAIGPIMQGFARPFNDLSRGATVEDVVTVAAIAVVKAQALA
ncbi:MAG: phosphate acetyltransferase [Gemmatimonadota bacterium]